MSKETNCPKCGENMEEIQRKIAVGPGHGPQGTKYPEEEIHFKYKCLNSKCSNYKKEFYENELEENHP